MTPPTLPPLRRILTLAALLLIGAPAAPAAPAVSPHSLERSIEQAYAGFRNPPAEARPFVRWWWNNNQVEEGEILRELDVLAAAGIGGVEINPIAGPAKPETSRARELTWRSPEWDRMLLVACKGARERGLIVDLIAGSGWPFGGEFLAPGDQIMRVSVIREEVTGPTVLRRPVAEILQRPLRDGRRAVKAVNPSLSFVSVCPVELTSMDQVREVGRGTDRNDVLEIEIGAGRRLVSYGILEQGYRKVTHGAKGAAGPTMDHMQKRVTRAYLDRLRGVEESWGEPLSTYVRAIFCDSIETSGANWTHDMLLSFRKRKGYDIAPYLPFVIDPEGGPLSPVPELADLLRRARYDWNEHNVTVFLENFTAEVAAFCHDHGLLSRYQAYGIPYLMGMAEGYMIPDIPETNNWLYSQGGDQNAEGRYIWNQAHGYMIWTKYASAGGRLRGRKIISSEAMTNTSRVFQTTLATIKQSDDMNFIAGVNHSVLHGYNYVPPDVAFPGWIRYGAYFSEHNTWWKHFPRWVDYNARLSHVFQETRPVAEVALLGPTPDLWGVTGLNREPFHLTPDYLHRLWEPLSQLGAGCDYLHEAVIQQAAVQGGRLRIGPMAYRVLVVADVHSLQPETAEAIARFARKGGKVIYVDRTPQRSPGLLDAASRDERVKSATAAALKAGAHALPGPPKGADAAALRDWTRRALKQANLDPPLRIVSPRDGLYSLHHQAPDAELFFFANTYRRESSRSRVDVALGDSGLWRWDPETGERHPYDRPYDAGGFEIDLRPLESILLVTGAKKQPDAPGIRESASSAAFTIASPWSVTFDPARSGEAFTAAMPALSDFTSSKDPRIRTFSGTATYRTAFQLKDPAFTELNLGWDNDFISEVELNGAKLGVNWYGSRLFEVRDALRSGDNELVIRYTTTLWNAMKKTPLQPAGLAGPVTLR